MLVADCHNDLLIGCLHLRERGVLDPFGDFWLEQLRLGGVGVQVLPVYVEEQFVGEGALRRSLMLLEEAYRIQDQHPHSVAICLTPQEWIEAVQSGRIGCVLALEGAEGVGRDLDILHTYQRLGVRMISMTWNRRTMMADGIGERDTGGRLTTLGVEAVEAMESLGIIVDVSHLSEAGFWNVAEVAQKPFVASHSSCRELQDHPRNLSDDQCLAVGGSGGFVALNAFGPFLADDAEVGSLIAHARHASALIGADHVGLGMDFMFDLMRQVDPILGGALIDIEDIPFPEGLRRPADLASLAECMTAELGEVDATWIMGRTLYERLIALLPGS